MGTFKRIFLISVIAFSVSSAWATHYFVSNTGNDNNNGLSKATPWLSLQRINKSSQLFLLQRGDSIFLERGSIFREQLDIARSGIYVGAYGLGPAPVISGSTRINDWTLIKKNIWKAKCSNCVTSPENIFVNNKPQPLGRYPNNGYLSISGSQSLTSFYDKTLQFTDGYWNMAEVVVRSSRWTLDNVLAPKYAHNIFTLAEPISYPIQPGFGYFIQKHLSTLDQQGEWYFNPETSEVFIFLNTENNPNTLNIEASTIPIGFNFTQADDVTIENLEFRNQQITGIRANSSNNITVKCVTLLNEGKNGIEILSCSDPLIENSIITGSNNNGVEWRNNTGGIFINNVIRKTGMIAGRGASGNGAYIAISLSSENNPSPTLFQYNTLDSIGYIGIDFRGKNIQLKNNRIMNFCLTKDDGAGIYTWGNTAGNNIIEGNTIANGIGTGDGSNDSNQLFASGIYIDDHSSHVLINNNTVTNCSTAGIFLHNATNITVMENTLVGNGGSIANKEKGQLYIKLDTLGQFAGNYSLCLGVFQNIFIVESDASYGIYLSAEKDTDLNQLGTFSRNQYRASHTYQAVGRSCNQLGLCLAPEEYTLNDWQEESGYEDGSSFKYYTPERLSLMSKNLVHNGNMTSNTDGWMVWPKMSAMGHEKNKIIDGPSLKINMTGNESESLVYHAGFALDKNKIYRLTFSAMSIALTRIEFAPLMAKTPWQSVGDHTCFTVDSTYRTFTYYFKPSDNCTEARVNFKGNQTFWIDNVSLNEIIQTVAVRDEYK